MFRDVLSDLRYRIRTLVHRAEAERDLADEVQFHLEREAERLITRGTNPDEARRHARLAFGDIERTKEEVRDARGIRWLEIVLQDARTAFRSLSAQPLFTIIAAGSLAVGISVAAGTSTIVATVRGSPLPFGNADRVVVFDTHVPDLDMRPEGHIPLELLQTEAARGNRVVTVAASYLSYGMLRTDAWATMAVGQTVTPSYTSVLGLRPMLGRPFTPGDGAAGAPRVLILGYRLWASRFGADSAVVGRLIRLGANQYTIIGVTAADQQLNGWGDFLVAKSLSAMAADSQKTVFGIGALARGATVSGAVTEMSAILPPELRQRHHYGAMSLRTYLLGQVKPALEFMTVLGVLVAMVAGINFATLVLGRGMRRREELGIRSALGASTGRLLVHMIAECAILSVIGGVLGSIMAPAVLHTLSQVIPQILPPWVDPRWGLQAAAAAVVVAMAVGIVFGLAPAIELARPAAAGFLRGGAGGDAGARRHQRSRRLLVSTQVAVAVWPIVAFAAMSGVGILDGFADPGFDATNRFSGIVSQLSPDSSWGPKAEQAMLLSAVRRAPGVIAAGLGESDGYFIGSAGGPAPSANRAGMEIGSDEQPIFTDQVSAGFFDARGLRLVTGRFPTNEELSGAAPVAVVTANASVAFEGDTSVGWPLRLRQPGKPSAVVTVVGVVADIRQDLRGNKPLPRAFTPFFPAWEPTPKSTRAPLQTLWIRGGSSSHRLVAGVFAAVRRFDPHVAVADLQSVVVQEQAVLRQFLSIVAVGAGLFFVALGLASVGIYGIIAYAAVTRRKEMAVRFVLGGTRAHIGFLVVREAAVQVAIGLALGVVAGLLTAQAMVPRNHPLTSPPLSVIGVALLALGSTLLVASIAPVRRVWGTSPASALREDG